MASFSTPFYLSQTQLNSSLHQPSTDFRPIQQGLKKMYVRYTCLGTEVAADIIKLGSIGLAGVRVYPELSRITAPSAGGVIISAKLQALPQPTGSAVDLAVATVISNNRVALSPIAGLTEPVVGETDVLQLLLSQTASTTFTMTAGQFIDVELVYTSDQVD